MKTLILLTFLHSYLNQSSLLFGKIIPNKQNFTFEKVAFSDSIENRIIEKIRALKTLKNINADLNKKGIALQFFIKEKPNKKNAFYWIQVGQYDNLRLRILYNFFYKKNGRLFLLDPVKNKKILIKEDF